MTALVANFVGMTVLGAPGTGTITLGSPIAPGSISFATAYGQDTTVDLTYVDGVNRACETGCIYNHASNTITRGYNETSTTGTTLSLTSNALVFVSWPASKVNAFNQMFVNVGTDEIPVWQISATILPRTDTLANLALLNSGGGELCSAIDTDAIVQLNGTPGSGTVKYYSPMYPGTYTSTTRSSRFQPTGPLSVTHTFTIQSYQDDSYSGVSGALYLRGGDSVLGHGGPIGVYGGSAPSTKQCGLVIISGRDGSGAGGLGGGVVINAGAGNSGATAGKVYLRVGGTTSFEVNTGNAIGFFGTTPTTKPAVVGPITGEGALTSLLTALNSLGLVDKTGVTAPTVSSISYNADTSVASVTDGTGTTSITYDGQGRPSVVTSPLSTLTINYNVDGTVASIT